MKKGENTEVVNKKSIPRYSQYQDGICNFGRLISF